MDVTASLSKLKNARSWFIGIPPCGPEPSISFILRSCHKVVKNLGNENVRSLLLSVSGCLDRMLERLNIGNWKDICVSDRQIVTLLSFYKMLLYLDINYNMERDQLLKHIFEIIDTGILFGAPLSGTNANLLQRCASLIYDDHLRLSNIKSDEDVRFSTLSNKKKEVLIENGKPIAIEILPSLESFQEKFMKNSIPVILQKCFDDWPALELWDHSEYFIQNFGDRIVPIEIGSKYTDSDWSQKLIMLSDYIKTYIVKEPLKTAYLAQHQLFDQIPELTKDFRIPEYCYIRNINSKDEFIDKNAWFGPSGTISPLHTDPKQNLLAQVIGEKLIILFSPNESLNLYPHPNLLLNNTAQVDPLNPDYNKYPNYRKASCFYHILKPGEMLYIPSLWWHYVQSLSVSFSVSFWWH